MAKTRHYDLARLARARATENWGYEENSKHAAVKGMSPEQVVQGGILELVRRLNQAIRAWAADADLQEHDEADAIPKWAAPLPWAKVGDVLYSCGDLSEGIGAYVVLHKDDKGILRLARVLDDYPGGRVYLHWSQEDYHPTRALAAAAGARSDMRYSVPRTRRAQQVLEAIERGEDFEHLLGELDDDEE